MDLIKKLFCVFLLIFNLAAGFGENKYSWDFEEGNLRDIIYAVSLDSGVSIYADETVTGKGSWKFTGDDFDRAFDGFLESNRLFVDKKDKIWTVSRIKIEKTDSQGKTFFSVGVWDLPAVQILEKLAEKINIPVTYDFLPQGNFSIHLKNLPLEELMDCIAMRFSGVELVKKDNCFYFTRESQKKNDLTRNLIDIAKENEGYKVNVRDAKVCDVMERLFEIEGCQFCFLANPELKIARANFEADTFEKTLKLLCSQNGFVSVVNDGICYLVADSDVKNQIVNGKKNWEKISLKFSAAEKIIPLIAKKTGKLDTVIFPDGRTFLIKAGEEEYSQIEQLVEELDVQTDTYAINLKYIRPDDFMKHIPPSVDKTNICMAEDKSCVYFTGTEEAYLQLCHELELFDKPADRISYDLLILQCDETSDNEWSSGFSVDTVSAGDRTGGGIRLGSVLGFNLNVVSTFGLNFAYDLQTSIEENKTRVFADTILHGISGKTINFQNTNTYRYRDNNLDPETGKPVYSGITREIISGLKLEVLGWISGDGMITSTVTASVTRRGTDTSSSTGNPPPTTEKIITTEVCGKSGEPVVLSGLVQNADTLELKRSPWISRIPLLGKLFTNQEKIQEKSQMIIYLVPHADSYKSEKPEFSEVETEAVIKKCREFVKKFMEKENA